MKTIGLLVCLCLVATTLETPMRRNPVDDFLKQILEILKEMMPTGIPELDIPPLDPFEVPEFDDIHIDEDIIGADISIKNLVITNLSTFVTEISHLELEDLSLELELAIPVLRGDAWYNLTGEILTIFPLYGDGDIWLEIYDLDVYAKAAVIINTEGYVEITQMVLSANFTSIKTHLDNLLGGGNFGESVNNLLNLLGDYIWDLVKNALFPLLEKVLTDVLNDALDGCNIADLIASGSCFKENLQQMELMIHKTMLDNVNKNHFDLSN